MGLSWDLRGAGAASRIGIDVVSCRADIDCRQRCVGVFALRLVVVVADNVSRVLTAGC